ncbi:MAG: GGDEF domain-containing protein [Ruminococcus sp.]|nr:GGDEF domain-containing protein [Ruminococcus sp.]
MNLQSIIITNCIGAAMLIVLLLSSYLVRQRRQVSDKLFTAMIILTGSACIIEMLTFVLDGKDFTGARVFAWIGNSWLYFSNVLISFVWCVYVDLRFYGDGQRIRKYYPFLALPVIVCTAALLVNVYVGFLFRIDEDNYYVRKPMGYLFYLVTLFYLVFSLVLRMRYRRKYGRMRFFPIWMFLAPIVGGATAQMLVYGISLAWTSVALGLVGIHMSMQNELSYIDPLTKLYNRNYLEHFMRYISRKGVPAGGLMIDIDYFKNINDRFGHSVGDEALADAAKLIKSAVPSRSVTIRYAGDEFVVMIRTADKEEIKAAEESIRRRLKEFNDENSRVYKLSFSIGWSFFSPQTTADDFLIDMDENMYAEKREKHSRSAEKVRSFA